MHFRSERGFAGDSALRQGSAAERGLVADHQRGELAAAPADEDRDEREGAGICKGRRAVIRAVLMTRGSMVRNMLLSALRDFSERSEIEIISQFVFVITDNILSVSFKDRS